MAFFTDMKRSLTEAGKQVAQKTKEVSDTVQLKTQISREKEAVNRQYAQIGKKVFEAANTAHEEAYSAEFALIRESLKTIDELQDKLSTLEGFIHCPECGAKIEKTSAFCSKCGAKIAETKPEDDDIDVVGPDAGGYHGQSFAFAGSRYGVEFAVGDLFVACVEMGGHHGHPARVAYEDDRIGQVFRP